MNKFKDPIVDEIRKFREEHAAAHGYNLRRFFDDLRTKESNSNHKIVSRRPKVHSKSAGSRKSAACVQ